MKIAIMGAGGEGGYLGGRLAQAGRDVAFIARGEHLAAMRRRGLQVRSPLGDFAIQPALATDRPADVGPVDMILFCVKAYDVASAGAMLQPMIGPQTAILPVQNGLEHLQTLAELVGAEHLLGGVSALGAIIAEPGVIQHLAGSDTIYFGEMAGGSSPRCEAIREALTAPGFEAIIHPNIMERMWLKLATYCGASVCCAARGDRAAIWDHSEIQQVCRQAAAEAVAVARARGFDLSPAYPDELVVAISGWAPAYKPSMLVALERGQRLEVEAINGVVCRAGRELGIATPANDFIYACLKPWAAGRR